VDNPFERYDLDPREGITAITQRLKELAEDAKDDVEREHIRAAWEELTLHPARRLRAALFAHPETRGALGMPPALPRRRGPRGNAPSLEPEVQRSAAALGSLRASRATRLDLTVRDLAARPSLLLSLGVDAVKDEDVVPSFEDDPVLRGLP
jgi:hypothetical protein